MNPRKLTLIAIVPALFALAAAGCGGTSDSGGGSGSQIAARRLLDAQGGLRGGHPRVPEDPEPARASRFSQSFGASGDQSRAVESGLPADVVALLARARHRQAGQDRASSPRTGTTTPTTGLVTNSVVVLRRPQGQPEEHQDLGRPAQARRRGAHAQPVHLRRRAVERDGRLRRPDRAGQDRRRRRSTTSRRCSRTSSCRTRPRREALQTFTAGKGDVLLAYENEAITAQQKGEDVDYVIPDETILIENPIAVDHEGQGRRAGEGVRRLRAHARGARRLRREGLPARSTRRLGERSTKFPDAARRCSRSTSSAAGRKVNDEFFDPDKGSVAKIEEDARCVHRQVRHVTRRPPAAGRPPILRSDGRRRSAWARGHRLAEPDRPDPAGRRRRAVDRRRPRRRSGTRSSSPQARRALRFTLLVSLVVGRDQRRDRARSSPGCSCATSSAARRSSTRIIDLPFALPTIVAGLTLLALYGPKSPVGINVAFTQAAVAAGAAVRDAALRRALRAAGADRARPRDGGGRDVARRPPADGLPPHHPAQPRARDPLRRRRSAFARAVGEFGSVVLISRQHAVRDRGRVGVRLRPDRERRRPRRRGRGVRRAAGDLVRCCCSAICALVREGACAMTASASRLRAAIVALGYLPPCWCCPSGWSSTGRSSTGIGAGLGRGHDARGAARVLADAARSSRSRCRSTRSSACGMALVLVRGRVPRQGAARRAHRPAVRRLAGRRRPGADPRLRAATAGSAAGSRSTASR